MVYFVVGRLDFFLFEQMKIPCIKEGFVKSFFFFFFTGLLNNDLVGDHTTRVDTSVFHRRNCLWS